MDEQSGQDSTIVLHYNEELSLWAQSLEDAELPFNIPGAADVSEDDIWWRWRLPISGAHHLFNSVDDDDFVMMNCFHARSTWARTGWSMSTFLLRLLAGRFRIRLLRRKVEDVRATRCIYIVVELMSLECILTHL